MSLFNLYLYPHAEEDLEEIFIYTFQNWGENQAYKYLDQIEIGFDQICRNSEIGQLYVYAPIEYRRYHVNKHLIFYRIEKQKCIIIRILHQSMAINDKLQQK